jgi:putative ABC transport system substrate-binding protein
MKRRNVILLLGGAALGGLPRTRALAQPAKIYRIGILSILPRPSESVFRDAMRDLGYVEGKNVVYETHYSGKAERLADTAADLIRAKPDVIVTAGGPAAVAAKAATATIPIVLWGAGDPVGTGLVVNVSHPGGNITGVTELSTELTAKRLQLFKDLVPRLKRVAVIWNVEDLSMSLRFQEAETAAPRLGLSIMRLPIHDVDDFETVFAALKRDPPDGVFVVTDRITAQREPALIELLRTQRIPSAFEFPPAARAGGLISYGPSIEELAPRAAAFVDRILKGAKPGDLPLEAPVRWHLIVNRRTAAAIGVEIPASILARADEVIE